MDRLLRIEFSGAVYHVTFRNDRGEDIFVDDQDGQGLLAVAAQALSRFEVARCAHRTAARLRGSTAAHGQRYCA